MFLFAICKLGVVLVTFNLFRSGQLIRDKFVNMYAFSGYISQDPFNIN